MRQNSVSAAWWSLSVTILRVERQLGLEGMAREDVVVGLDTAIEVAECNLTEDDALADLAMAMNGLAM